MRSGVRFGATTLGMLCVFAALDVSAQPAAARITHAPAFEAADLDAAPTDRWITNGGSLRNQRYSPLAAINRDNVAQLKGVWRSALARLRHRQPSIRAKRSRSSTTA